MSPGKGQILLFLNKLKVMKKLLVSMFPCVYIFIINCLNVFKKKKFRRWGLGLLTVYPFLFCSPVWEREKERNRKSKSNSESENKSKSKSRRERGRGWGWGSRIGKGK